ncbi:MAG: nuclear transport factor 2 family protein [Nevskia sp.]|nr:nuclear transport factor 2 family protein [Nevskia sp.]
MRTRIVSLLAAVALLAGCAGAAPQPVQDRAELQKQVMETEQAFAKSMADRDHAAFTSHLSEEAVFFSDPNVLRGKQAVADAWKPYFAKPAAPFSWKPEHVEVLDSGTLALSSGPVYNPQGKLIATFNSIWRLEAPGVWRIVFDKGSDVCK